MKLIKTILFALCLTAIATSCNDNDPNYESIPFTSLVTYDRTVASGDNDISKDVAYFTFYTDNNNAISYFATGMTRKIEAQPGDRMIIAYYMTGGQSYGQSGQISLYTYRKVPGGNVEVKSTAEAEAANAPIYINWLNRTGNYINLSTRIMSNPDRTFTMIADEATVGQPTIDVYITTAVPATGDTGVVTEEIASFNMESVWHDPTTTKVRVHVNNTAGTQKVFEFSK